MAKTPTLTQPTNGASSQLPATKPLLEVKNLRKFFPIRKGFLRSIVGHVRAVDDVSFSIRKGETLSLVGESGCGKTTTSRCILRALNPTSGEINFHSDDTQILNVAKLSKGQLRPLRRQTPDLRRLRPAGTVCRAGRHSVGGTAAGNGDPAERGRRRSDRGEGARLGANPALHCAGATSRRAPKRG